MADISTEQSGEHQIICVQQKSNGALPWKWIAGILASIILGGFVSLHVSIARVEEQVKSLASEVDKNWTIQSGLNGRLDNDVREAQKDIIRLYSRHGIRKGNE